MMIQLLSLTALAVFSAPPAQYLAYEAGPPVKLTLGKEKKIPLTFRVAEGLHVQANPTTPPLIPTALTVEPTPGFQFGPGSYPVGKPYRLSSMNSEIPVYAGKFDIVVPVKTEKGTRKGKYTLSAKVRYQACNDQNCFFPTTLPLAIPVEVN